MAEWHTGEVAAQESPSKARAASPLLSADHLNSKHAREAPHSGWRQLQPREWNLPADRKNIPRLSRCSGNPLFSVLLSKKETSSP